MLIDLPQAGGFGFFFQVAHSSGVLHELDESAFLVEGDDSVGFEPYFDILPPADLLYHRYQLHSHVLLPQIVPRFYNERSDPVRAKTTVGRIFGYPLALDLPLGPEVRLREDQTLLLLFFAVGLSALTAVLGLDQILVADGLVDYFEGDPLLGGKGETMRVSNPHSHIRGMLDGQQHSLKFRILPIKFIVQLLQPLPQIIISILLDNLLKFIRDVKQSVVVIIDTDSIIKFSLLIPHDLR